MRPRLDFHAAAPKVMAPLMSLKRSVDESGLEAGLIELVKIRASQINGCAFCIHLHTAEARRQGESEARIYLLDAWRHSPLFTPREQAALAWTEALTLVAETQAPDADYAAIAQAFTAEEQVKLTMLIATINALNRLAIGFRSVHPTAGPD